MSSCICIKWLFTEVTHKMGQRIACSVLGEFSKYNCYAWVFLQGSVVASFLITLVKAGAKVRNNRLQNSSWHLE